MDRATVRATVREERKIMGHGTRAGPFSAALSFTLTVNGVVDRSAGRCFISGYIGVWFGATKIT